MQNRFSSLFPQGYNKHNFSRIALIVKLRSSSYVFRLTNNIKLRCETRFQRAFTACGCSCSKRMRKTLVATQLKNCKFQPPLKMTLATKLIKCDTKIIISLFQYKSLTHDVQVTSLWDAPFHCNYPLCFFGDNKGAFTCFP
jgi:hypothetical protein